MTGIVCALVGNSVVTAVAEVIRRKKGITAVGNAQISTAQSAFGGASLLLDGNGDYLQIESYSDFAVGTGDFTVEFWFRNTSISTTQALFDMRDPDTDNAGFVIGLFTSKLFVGTTNSSWIFNGQTLSNNIWYHVALVRSSGSMKLYVNGTQDANTYSSTQNFTNTKVRIGYGPNGFAYGHFDEIRFSKSARYTSNFTTATTPFVNDDNTLLLIHADGTNASTFFEDDNGVRAQRGIVANGNAQVDTAQSKFGGASAYFDGTGDALQIEHAGTMRFGTGNFTMECWYRPTARSQTYPLVFSNRAGFTNGCIIFHDRHDSNQTKFTIWIYNLSTSSPIFTSTTTVVNGTWYHLAVSKSGSSIRFFVNGTQEGSTYTSSADIDTGASTSPYYLGYPGASSDLNGHIDEVRVSNTARYTANFTAPTAPFQNDTNTLLLLHMDGTDGSTVFRDDNGVRAQRGIVANGNAQVDTAQSKFGGASALFDGSGDYLTVSAGGFNVGTGNITVEFWVRHNAINDQQVYCDLRSAGNSHLIFYIRSDNKLELYDGLTAYTSTATLAANTWYHLAISRSGSSLKVYIDGVEAISATNSRNLSDNSVIIIGTDYTLTTGNSMNGWIDELRISNSARYTANFTPSTTPFQNDANTLLLLHMDGTDASTVFIDDNGRNTTPAA